MVHCRLSLASIAIYCCYIALPCTGASNACLPAERDSLVPSLTSPTQDVDTLENFGSSFFEGPEASLASPLALEAASQPELALSETPAAVAGQHPGPAS